MSCCLYIETECFLKAFLFFAIILAFIRHLKLGTQSLFVPATGVAEVGGLTQFRNLRPAWQHSKTPSQKRNVAKQSKNLKEFCVNFVFFLTVKITIYSDQISVWNISWLSLYLTITSIVMKSDLKCHH